MADHSADTGAEASQQRFESILSRERFKGLKAIFENLSAGRAALCEQVAGAASYEQLLVKLGYRVILTKQIHVQDCYSRLGPAGGIKAVLPYHDIPTQSSLPTLVNFDATVTTTPKAAGFFDQILAELKAQLKRAD